MKKYEGIKTKPDKIIQLASKSTRKLAIMEKIWHKKAQLLKILEQARRGVQNLEKEFSKNHNDMSALKMKIQKELNYSKNSNGETPLQPNFEDMSRAIDHQFYAKNNEEEKRLEGRGGSGEDEIRIEGGEFGVESFNELQKTSLKNLIEPSPNSNFIKDVFSGIDTSNMNEGKNFKTQNGSVDRYQVDNEIAEVDEENEVDSQDLESEGVRDASEMSKNRGLRIETAKKDSTLYEKSESEEPFKESPRFAQASEISEVDVYKGGKGHMTKLTGRVYKTTSDDYNNRGKFINNGEIADSSVLKKSFHSTNAKRDRKPGSDGVIRTLNKDSEDDVFSFKGDEEKHNAKKSKSQTKSMKKSRMRKSKKNPNFIKNGSRKKNFIYLNRNSVSPIKKILEEKTSTKRTYEENQESNLKNSFSFSDLNKQKQNSKIKAAQSDFGETSRKRKISDYSTKSNHSKSSNRSRRRKSRNKSIRAKKIIKSNLDQRGKRSYLSKYVSFNNSKKTTILKPGVQVSKQRVKKMEPRKSKNLTKTVNIYVTHPITPKYMAKLNSKKNILRNDKSKEKNQSELKSNKKQLGEERNGNPGVKRGIRKSNFKDGGYYSQKKHSRVSRLATSSSKTKMKTCSSTRKDKTAKKKLRHDSNSISKRPKDLLRLNIQSTKKKYSIISAKNQGIVAKHQRTLTPANDRKAKLKKEIIKHKSLTRVKKPKSISGSGSKLLNKYDKQKKEKNNPKLEMRVSNRKSKKDARTYQSEKNVRMKMLRDKRMQKKEQVRQDNEAKKNYKKYIWRKCGSIDKNRGPLRVIEGVGESRKGYSSMFQSKIKRRSKIGGEFTGNRIINNIERPKRNGVTVSLGINVHKRNAENKATGKYLMRKSAND